MKENINQHIVFFDGECPACLKAVQHLIVIDDKRHIQYAPFKGETATKILCGPLKKYTQINSLVLIENYQSTEREFWIRSRAIMRIYWLIGSGWKIFGWMSFLPGGIGDFFYKKLAHHRHQFKLKPTDKFIPEDRFLP